MLFKERPYLGLTTPALERLAFSAGQASPVVKLRSTTGQASPVVKLRSTTGQASPVVKLRSTTGQAWDYAHKKIAVPALTTSMGMGLKDSLVFN